MRIISIANQKGGCGKTTTAINLSTGLALKGRKVLLIDLDPQGHSAMGLNIDTDNLEKTVHDALGDAEGIKSALDEVIVKVTKNIDIAPSKIGLSTFEQNLSMIPGRENRLREAVAGLCRSYDYIIIDCPPSLGLLTFNALMAAIEVFIPIEMGLFSLHGTSRLLEILDLIREKTGQEIRVKVIATMFDRRTRIGKEVLKEIEDHFEGSMFKTVIDSSVKLREAAGFGRSIHDYAKKSKACNDYMALVKEVIEEERIPGLVKKRDGSFLQPDTGTMKFFIRAPEANCVKVVGTFNNWNQSEDSLLEPHENGIWSKDVQLAPGVYQYKFLIDDVWAEDRNNHRIVEDSYGGRNSVIEVRVGG
jgi:chromosome partitioning protein